MKRSCDSVARSGAAVSTLSESPAGMVTNFTSRPSRILCQSSCRMSCSNIISIDFGVPMMYRRPPSRRNSMLSSLTPSKSSQTDSKRLTKTARQKHGRTFSPPEIFFPVGKLALSEIRNLKKRQRRIAIWLFGGLCAYSLLTRRQIDSRRGELGNPVRKSSSQFIGAAVPTRSACMFATVGTMRASEMDQCQSFVAEMQRDEIRDLG